MPAANYLLQSIILASPGDFLKIVTLLTTLLICAACQSKPLLEAKATKGGTPGVLYSAVLQIDDSQSPRSIGSVLFYRPEVQTCLRNAILKSGDDFSVSISGNLNANGSFLNLKVDHQYDSLRDCLGHEISNIDLGKGAAGPFKIEISRVRTAVPGGKTYELDLNDAKKFQ